MIVILTRTYPVCVKCNLAKKLMGMNKIPYKEEEVDQYSELLQELGVRSLPVFFESSVSKENFLGAGDYVPKL